MEQFRAAVQALFGQDPAGQQEANVWLQGFASSPAAWEAGLGMLEPGLPSNLLFFAANLLLNKSRTDWAKLPAEHKAQLTSAVGWVAMGDESLPRIWADLRAPTRAERRRC